MLNELDALEARLGRLLEHHRRVLAENHLLRQKVATLEAANQRLTERLGEARQRTESLLQKLPD